MIERVVTVSNRAGIHARPAAVLVRAINGFACTIQLTRDTYTVNAKSIMSVITLGAPYGAQLTVKVDGPDEQDAIDTIVRLFESKFTED
ncbi:MAG: HPr family phosphocarrier protein [Treponema sp.]|jgi:phosphocarrier protein|nr:HPr family phosphocarrier protein [Treponema sp.]